MVDIYVVNINKELRETLLNRLLLFLSEEKQKRIKRFRRFDDAKRTLIGDVLARLVICNKLNIKNKDIAFTKNNYGKPFLQNFNNFYFNISHAGEWVVCATHCRPLGIDIEYIKPIDFDIAKQFFSKYEYKDLLRVDSTKRLSHFYELWTLKESYIKAVGKGLCIPLDSFSLKVKEDQIALQNICNSGNYFFKLYNIDYNYKMAVCASSNELPDDITIINFDVLISSAIVTLNIR